MDEITLQSIGLNKNESIVYLALLKTGTCGVTKLAQGIDLHRAVIYDNLERLIEKGLVSYILEGKHKKFSISPPEMLNEFLDKKQVQLDREKKQAELVKKAIEAYTKDQPMQDASLLRGVNGVKLLYKDILKTKKTLYCIGAPQASVDIMGLHFWQNYNLKRELKGSKVKLIFNESLRKYSKENIEHRKNTEVRFLQDAIEPISEIQIYDDKVATVVWTKNPVTTLIHNKNVADSYRQYFDILWKSAS